MQAKQVVVTLEIKPIPLQVNKDETLSSMKSAINISDPKQ